MRSNREKVETTKKLKPRKIVDFHAKKLISAKNPQLRAKLQQLQDEMDAARRLLYAMYFSYMRGRAVAEVAYE